MPDGKLAADELSRQLFGWTVCSSWVSDEYLDVCYDLVETAELLVGMGENARGEKLSEPDGREGGDSGPRVRVELDQVVLAV